MIRLHLKYRSDDDDYAPIDYSFVSSQAEGQRRKEAEAIHRGPGDAVVRHRADPNDRKVDAYGTHARRSPIDQAALEPVRRGLPSRSDGPAPAQRIAYPQGREPAWEEEEEAVAEAAQEEEVAAQEEAQEGPLFDDPAPPEIPEWLRIAKQNNMPLTDRPLRKPTVMAAPRQEEPQRDMLGRPLTSRREDRPLSGAAGVDYQEAGYPQELLQQQYEEEQAARAEAAGSRLHGAQYAGRRQRLDRQQTGPTPPVQPVQPRNSYPPGREELGRQDSRRRALSSEEREAWQAYAAQGYAGEAPRGYAGDYAPQGHSQAGYANDYAPQGEVPRGYANDYAPRGYAGEGVPAGDSYGYPQAYAPQAVPRRAAGNAPPAYDPYWQQGYGAAPPPPQAYGDPAAYARRTRAARPEEERDQAYAQEETHAGRSIPWLGIGTAATAFLAVILWLMQMSFATQTQNLLREREETAAAIRDSHPYRYRELIETQAQLNNLHPAFIAAIVLNESSFNPQAESSVGARGLMQMMPDTAEWVHGKIAEGEEYSFDSMYDPNINVRYACWYMKFLSERFRGDPVLVAAAFHAGQGTVQNWLNDSRYSTDSQTIDLEDMMDGPTKSYASRVLNAYAVYKGLYYQDQGTL